ncbi:MAG: asparagine synthase-related protein [Alteraurantiacibacter sp.]
MSAIAAIFHPDGDEPAPDALDPMLRTMRHYGPDGSASWSDERVALGHLALHGTAEERASAQPLHDTERGTGIVMDGYLLNREELLEELAANAVPVIDRSDAAIVLAAYRAWGEDAPRHCEGEFAFAIWDARRSRLLCARDHQGMRPLFYYWDGRRLVVASSIAGVCAALPRNPRPNTGLLAELAAFRFYTREETVRSGVMRLVQGHCMIADASGIRSREYWQLPFGKTLRYRHDAQYAEHYRELLTETVRRCARSDRPIAAEVSGGLDSTALFCIAHDMQRNARLPAPTLRGYTLDGPKGSPADEIAYVEAVERERGVRIARVPHFLPDLDWFAEEAVNACDMPLMPNGALSIGEEREAAADGCRAVMNGVGGDQWLYGTRYYYRELLGRADGRGLWRAIHRDAEEEGWQRSFDLLLHYGIGPLAPTPLLALARKAKQRLGQDDRPYDDLLTDAARTELADRRAECEASRPHDPEARAMQEKLTAPWWSHMFDLNARQVALSGVEQRHPFLARRLVEFLAAIPADKLRHGGDTGKLLHRDAMKGVLPEQVRTRRGGASSDAVFARYAGELRERLSRCDWPVEGIVDRARLTARLESPAPDGLALELWGAFGVENVTRGPD